MYKFVKAMDAARNRLWMARWSLGIWKTLAEPDDRQAETHDRMFNMYVGFFQPTVVAHSVVVALNVATVSHPNGKLPSLYGIVRLVEKSPVLAPKLNTKAVVARLDKQRPELNRIKKMRDRRVAHFDLKAKVDSLLLSDCLEVVPELEGVYNDIYHEHTRRPDGSKDHQSFLMLEHDHVNYVLNHLKNDIFRGYDTQEDHP